MFFDKPKQEYKQNKPPFCLNISAFCKNETAFGECPNAVLLFLRIFVLIGRVGSCGFESKNHGLQIVATAQRKKTIGRIVLPIVFLCVALCDQIVLPGYTFRASSKHFTAAFKSSSLRTYAILACFLPFSGSE